MRKSRKKEKLEQEENNWKDLDQQTNKTELKKFKEVKKNLLKRQDERIKDAKKQTIKVNALWSLRQEIQTQTVDATLPH